MPAETPDLLTQYKHAQLPLPDRFRRWHLYGAGLENVGKEGQPETLPLPEPGPDEILVRHDACGICFSDIKIINLGSEHPRIQGRDLKADPVIMGHEVALTVIQPGANYTEKFAPGQRYIVQADVFYKGANVSYGYALPGGMAQYGLIGPEVLEGDEGCYLLPIQDDTGYAEAALVEPWACVEAAYHWVERRDREDGDLVFDATPSPEEFEARCTDLPKNAHVFLNFNERISRPVKLDVGRVHYDFHIYAGPKPNGRSEIKAGGTALFVGAAGPMGQMHVQRALQLPNPPAVIVGTDRQAERLKAMEQRFAKLAAERGVTLHLLNVADGEPDFASLAPNGFDDIVIMVPAVALIEQSFPLLAEGGVLNIFAGVARGTMATIDVNDIVFKNVRIVGTTGSTIEDMRRTRDVMESGQLDTGASLAAVGGLNAFRDGLQAVKEGRFPGKTVIFPQVEDLPLTSLADLKTVRPKVYEKLKDGHFWTDEAEEELLREALTGK
jgi:Threonine dehydrogenase and related Zn-dependent dehydrogenases